MIRDLFWLGMVHCFRLGIFFFLYIYTFSYFSMKTFVVGIHYNYKYLIKYLQHRTAMSGNVHSDVHPAKIQISLHIHAV